MPRMQFGLPGEAFGPGRRYTYIVIGKATQHVRSSRGRITLASPPYRTRRGSDPRKTAEAAFKSATTKPQDPEPVPKAFSVPGPKEIVSLAIDRDVLDFFQAEGPGWQDRINAALRKAARG